MDNNTISAEWAEVLTFLELTHTQAGMYKALAMDVLYVSNTSKKSLPESLGLLVNLQELYCSFNQITELPESIGNLTNLAYLDVSNNRLKSLPIGLSNLSKLVYLDVSNNRLTVKPSRFKKDVKVYSYGNLF